MIVIEEKISPSVRSILEHAARIARQQGVSLWLVGGVVRDMLLGIPITYDLDLVVEGDSIALAHALADAVGGTITAKHPEFGTASIQLPYVLPSDELPNQANDGIRVVDVAMARVETYPSPASLPIVSPASLEHDLIRRDYRINAMATQVNNQGSLSFSPILDPFDGMGDLRAGILQVLHERSFDDDPTRIIRGLRLAVRLGFTFAPATLALLTRALEAGRIAQTSSERIRNELCLALNEPAPDEVLRYADTIGLTRHILPGLCWTTSLAAHCQAIQKNLADPTYLAHVQEQVRSIGYRSLLLLGVLTYDLTMEERETCIARYRLSGDVAVLLRDVGRARQLLPRLSSGSLKPSEQDQLLRPLSDTALMVVEWAGEGETSAPMLAYYRNNLRPLKPILNGHDLQQLGVSPGPPLGKLLRELHAAYLDGEVVDRADAEAWVHSRIS